MSDPLRVASDPLRVASDPLRVLHEAGLDRRGFLRLVGAATAAGAFPLGCLAPPRRGRLLAELSQRMVGPQGAARIASGAVDPTAVVDAWMAGLGPLADALETALTVLEYGVWPLVPKLRPFTALDGAAQDAVLESLRTSRWATGRQVFAAAKTLGCLAYYASPVSHADLGFPGPFGDVADAMQWNPEA